MASKIRPTKREGAEQDRVEVFRRAQSAFFAVDSELRDMKRIVRKVFPKKVILLEEKRNAAWQELETAKRHLWKSKTRYLDVGDGTIIDCKTHLVGLKDAACLGKENWPDAMALVGTLASGFCGLSDDSRPVDWRLPDKTELPALFEWKSCGLFSGVHAYYHWSSSASIATPKVARLINIYNGGIYNVVKSNSYYIWPVRGGALVCV